MHLSLGTLAQKRCRVSVKVSPLNRGGLSILVLVNFFQRTETTGLQNRLYKMQWIMNLSFSCLRVAQGAARDAPGTAHGTEPRIWTGTGRVNGKVQG